MKKLGLVFSGGGGKGAYEIGVWKALKEFGIDKHINCMSGTSVGALNTALFIQGDYDKAEETWRTISQDTILKLNTESLIEKLKTPYQKVNNFISDGLIRFTKNRGFFSQNGLENLIRNSIDLNLISNSKLPAYVCAYNQTDSRVEYFSLNNQSAEDIVKLLLASSALPFVFDPIEFQGKTLIDGGLPVIGDNSPILPLQNEGCDIIICVMLSRDQDILNRKLDNKNHIWEIVPNEDQGGIIDGVLDFNPETAKRRIQQGYLDTKRILQNIYEFLLIEEKIIEKVEDIQEQARSFQLDAANNSLLVGRIENLRGNIIVSNNSLELLLSSNNYLMLSDSPMNLKIESLDIIEKKLHDELTVAEKKIISEEIDIVLEEWKDNSEKIKSLAFEGITALSPVKPRIEELNNRGFLKRIWQGITGKSSKLILENQYDIYKAVYVNQQLIKKLDERNLLTLELIQSMGNRIEYLSKAIQIANINTMVAFEAIASLKSAIQHIINALHVRFDAIERRIEYVENQVELSNWMHRLPFITFNGNDYNKLDRFTKIAVVSSEFYKISNGKITSEHYQMLRKALKDTGIDENENINVGEFLLYLKSNQSLLNVFLNNFCIAKEIFPIKEEETENYPLLKGVELARFNNSPTDENFIQTINNNLPYQLDTVINSHAFAIELIFSIDSAAQNRNIDSKKTFLSILQKCEEVDQNELSSKSFSKQISELKEKVESYEFVVPVVGAFSAGKSYLLNTFMERNILPIDTDRKTAVATELHYSNDEHLVIHYLDGKSEKKEISYIEQLQDNSSNVSYTQLYINVPKLNYLNGMILVDMPGVDSDLETHTKAILNYINRGTFYVLLLNPQFQIEKSVLKFINEITRYKQQFGVIYSRAAAYEHKKDELEITARQTIKKFTGEDVFVGFVESKLGQTDDFINLISKISSQKNIFIHQWFHDSIDDLLNSMKEYFLRMLNRDNMSIRDLQSEIESIQSQISENEKEFKKEAEKLSADIISNGVSRIKQKVNNALQSSIAVLASAAKAGNSSLNTRIQDIITPIIIEGINEAIKSSNEKLKNRLNNILDTSFSNISASVNLPTIGRGEILKKGALGAGVAAVFIINPILGILVGIASMFFGKKKNQDAEIEQQIISSVIPGVLQQVHSSIIDALSKASKEIEKQLEESFNTKQNEILNSLKEIEKKKIESEEIYEQTKAYWKESLGQINELKLDLEGNNG